MSSNNNLLLTLVGLSAMIFAFQSFNKTDVKENFGMLPPRTIQVQRVAQTGPQKGDFVEIPGLFQSSLSPNGGAGMVDYGANIRYNLPDNGHLRTPDYKSSTPLSYARMVGGMAQGNRVVEKYCGACGEAPIEGYCGNGSCRSSGCRVGGGGDMASVTKSSNLVSSNFSASAKQQNKLQYNQTTDMLPVADMSGGQALNALGEVSTQPIIYDRFIYANQKSRLFAQGDPIRGDLPIVPIASSWFRPSVHPQIDLRDGALAVVGGADNGTSNELLALQNAATAGLLDTGSGVNFAVQKSNFVSSGNSDIRVTSFP